MDFDSPENSYILNDFFTEPNFSKQELYTKTLEKMLIDCRNNDAKEVFIGVSENGIHSRSTIEKIGFTVYRKFQRTKTLWLIRKKEYS